MMELRLASKNNPLPDRFVVFSKHRRGDVGKQLYYSLEKSDVSLTRAATGRICFRRIWRKNTPSLITPKKFKQLFKGDNHADERGDPIKESPDTAREHFPATAFPYKVIRPRGTGSILPAAFYKLGGAEFQLSPSATDHRFLAKVHPEVLGRLAATKTKSAFRNYMMQFYGNLKVALRGT